MVKIGNLWKFMEKFTDNLELSQYLFSINY